MPQQQILAGDITSINSSESVANSNTTDTTFTQFNIGASIVWEMDFWGRFRRGIEAADAELLASIASYDETMVLLTAQVADVYAVIRATEEQLRLAKDSYTIQERSYEIADVLFRNEFVENRVVERSPPVGQFGRARLNSGSVAADARSADCHCVARHGLRRCQPGPVT